MHYVGGVDFAGTVKELARNQKRNHFLRNERRAGMAGYR